MENTHIVVGGGMAGLTAAAYLAKAKKNVILFEKENEIGGLMNSFSRNGFTYDGGLRSIENSGIVFPMLKDLGIDVDFTKSKVSVGIGDSVLKLAENGTLEDYEAFLVSFFPENSADIRAICRKIQEIMDYMDVLYGIDNPAFLDVKSDLKYARKVLLPWFIKYLFTIPKIVRLNEPVESYLDRMTNNRQLRDMIAQHFFANTPVFFALSYFKLYHDYYYPKGGTGTLPGLMKEYILKHGGEIRTNSEILIVNPELKFVIDHKSNKFSYQSLIWAADLKTLYRISPAEDISDHKIRSNIYHQRHIMKNLNGGESIFTLYLSVDMPPERFMKIASEHFFYTPVLDGLSTLDSSQVEKRLHSKSDFYPDNIKKIFKEYLIDFFKKNTYEISIPSLRDTNLAPEGKTGLVVSVLFDYKLTKHIASNGWETEMRQFCADRMIDVLDKSIFPGLKESIIDKFTSTPLTIQKRTGNCDGAITGWSFKNPYIPVPHKMTNIFKSTKTPLPNVYQAGQWSFSPSGLPISILTGKLAADKALK